MKNDTKKQKNNDNLDLQALLKKADKQTEFPEVLFDEFTPPTYEEWKENCISLLKGAPFDKKMYTKTYEGITFEPMYTRAMTEDILPKKSFPGMDDFMRGVHSSGYIKTPWGIAQACDETMPKDNNELLKHEIDKGSTIYNICLDSATLENKDAQYADKLGDIGCSVTTLEDMHQLLAGLDLEKHELYMYAGASPLPILSLTIAAMKASGVTIRNLHGVIGANPLGELVKHGKLYLSIVELYDEMYECARWAHCNAPKLKTIMVNSNVFSNGGANDVQEVAYTLSMAVSYIRALLERGIEINEAASQISFTFSMGANFFMQIAKLRAMRPLWAQIVKEFGGSESACKMHIHARPALFFKTVYDPYVNMLRNTTEIFSGVIGGVDSYENAPFDEPVRKGDEFSRRIARNVQIILQEEFGLLKPIDPSGGSWAVESLTQEIKEKIWTEFQVIEGKGGILAALEEGYPQKEIDKVLQMRFKNAELRRDRIVGNNMYPNLTEKPLDKREENAEAVKTQRMNDIGSYFVDLDDLFKQECLDKVAMSKSIDIVNNAIKAASAGSSIGELRKMINARGKNANKEQIMAILAHRWSERYEALRQLTEKYKKDTGENVNIFLANMGPIPQHKAREEFSTGFLQVGAFNVISNDGFKTTDEAVKAAEKTNADAVVICSTDKTYPEIVPDIAPKLKKALPNAVIYLAGAAPKDLEEAYRKAGVDDFISVRANCYKILQFLQKKKGMCE